MKATAKLRSKIIGITLLSLSTILIALLFFINAYNFSRVSDGADNTLRHIAHSGGTLDTSIKKPDSSDANPPSNDERNSTRYFTYLFNDDGTLEKIAYNISDISETDAEEITLKYGKELSNRGWYDFYYRYLSYEFKQKHYFTLVDQSRELEPTFRVMWSSIIAAFVGIFVTFLILIPLSKMIVKPIEENFEKQKHFISDASHELKTPLAIISLNNELEEAETGGNENTDNISKQIAIMSKMIKNLNELAKMDEEEKVPFSIIDITQIATNICDSFKGIVSQEGKKFTINIESNLSYFGNRDKIERLMAIFLDNATKYSKTFISFNVTSSQNKGIIIDVKNDAESLPNGDLPMVFERFYRLQETRSSSVAGSGIGLSMAKEIVSLHHGKISANGNDNVFEIKAIL